MPSWSYTHIKKNDSVTDSAIESVIRAEQVGYRSLAHLNGEYWFRDDASSSWVLVTPNGFYDTSEEAAESCRRISERFDTTVVMTLGQGNCSGIIFTVYQSGRLLRHLSAADGFLAANVGTPFDWEQDVFGDLTGEEVGISEITLEGVAEHLELSGYSGDQSWDVDRKVALSSPPPLPK
jgi:hypothetical protein